MGCCSASDLDDKKNLITTENYNWSQSSFADAYIGGKKFIFYKTKHHKRILVLRSWLRRLNISVNTDTDTDSDNVDKPNDANTNTPFCDKQDLITMVASYIKYEANYENEGNKNESLVVETNCCVVLPSNGSRIYEFKSLHIQPFGVLTVTKWIDCDYHHNVGGVLKIHCHGNITIDKNGEINLNGAGLTGLESDSVLRKYCGWNLYDDTVTDNGYNDDEIKNEEEPIEEIKEEIKEDDEKAIELTKVDMSISKPDLDKFENYYLAKGGSYFKIDKKRKNKNKEESKRKIKLKNRIYFGGIGGGSISLRCNNFTNNGRILANCTNKPKNFGKATNDREMLSKLQFFVDDGSKDHSGYNLNLKVVDVGIDGTGGCISIHVYNHFINHGLIEAMQFGEINVVPLEGKEDDDRKLIFGAVGTNINPFPKAKGRELEQIPTDELL